MKCMTFGAVAPGRLSQKHQPNLEIALCAFEFAFECKFELAIDQTRNRVFPNRPEYAVGELYHSDSIAVRFTFHDIHRTAYMRLLFG